MPILDNIFRGIPLGRELLISCSLLFCNILFTISVTLKPAGLLRKKDINISIADIAIIVYNLILFFSSVKDTGISFIPVEEWSTVLVAYFLTRNIQNANIISKTLIIAGTTQSIIALLQKIGYLKSNHDWFEVTGSFGNPGPLGGFLAICWVICLCQIYCGKQNKFLRDMYISASGLMIAAFYFADSRAAFVAVITGILFFFFPKIKPILTKRPFIVPLIAGIIILSTIFIFKYREDSANGRLLIWRVCSEMIYSKPLVGHGTASFAQDYMLHQAHYIATHPEARLSMTADSVIYPYNEFLHILTELGILGLSAIGIFLISLILHLPKNKKQRILKAGLITYICFSIFSYPNSVFPLFFLFAVLSGSIQSRSVFTMPVHSLTARIVLALSILACIASLHEIQFYHKGMETLKGFSMGNDKNAFLFSDLHYDRLKYSNSFVDIYRMQIDKNPDIEKAKKLPPDYTTYCTIGKAYMQTGQYDRAEKYLHTASFMIPGRITANYLLWKNFLLKGDTTNANITANQILKQPLKAEGTFAIRVRSEIIRFLKSGQAEE
ncbi:O-antigen ligase family protein [Coprobacter sp.]